MILKRKNIVLPDILKQTKCHLTKKKHVSGVAERIENVINNSYKGCGNKRKAEELIKLCGYGKIYGDTGKNIIDDFALKVGKKHSLHGKF